MTGDYHETNKVALSKVTRLLRGDFDNYLDAPVVGSTNTPETKETIVAKKKATGRLPGLEDADEQVDIPAELIELGLQYKRAQKKESDSKSNTKALFCSITDMMHKRGIQKFRVEIDGKMKWLCLDSSEKLKWVEVQKLKPDEIQ